jgi:uncharacterized membrane protein
LVGVGLGGFLDGVVLHQLLQWHHLLSEPIPVVDLESLRTNTFVDGVFHQVMWLVTVTGIGLLYWQLTRRDRLPATALIGGALIGWGAFNVIDEIVFHVALNLHHIRPGPDVVLWDLVFAGWGVAMVALGLVLARGRRYTARQSNTRL